MRNPSRSIFVVAAILACFIGQAVHAQCAGWKAGPIPIPDANANDDVLAAVSWDRDGVGSEPPRLVVGGKFTQIGGVTALHVAVWNGLVWQPMGNGLQGTVRALTVYNNQVYAAGEILFGGMPYVAAVWNGTSWLPQAPGNLYLGGAAPHINALAVFENQLYAAGVFDQIGPYTGLNNIARWNGASWLPLGSGIQNPANAEIFAMQVFNNELYVGGSFISAGGLVANNIARWSGTAWNTVGTGGANGGVFAFTVAPGALFAGGSFTTVNNGSVAANHVAKWNGSSWSALGAGTDGIVDALAYSSTFNFVYVGGGFFHAGGIASTNMALWLNSTSSWAAVDPATGGPVRLLLYHSDQLIVGGSFTNAGNLGVMHIARILNGPWYPMSPFQQVYSLATYQGKAVAAGALGATTFEGMASGIVAWDGANNYPFGPGFNGTVECVATYTPFGSTDPQLVACGEFTHSGDSPVNHIATWTAPPGTPGGSWETIGEGFNNETYVVKLFLSYLVAGGDFTASAYGTQSNLNHIAKYHPQTGWQPFTTGTNGYVWTLAARQVGSIGAQTYQLIMGGGFTTAGGLAANKIAGWTESSITPGGSWNTFGAGFDGDVVAVEVHPPGINQTIYAGGWFTHSGATSLNYIARWNGSAWVSFGNGIGADGPVFMLKSIGGILYAGGDFTSMDGVPAKGLAKWDGTAWSSVGGSIASGDDVLAIMMFHNEFEVGGRYQSVGSPPVNSPGWARYSDTGAPWIAFDPAPIDIECGSGVVFSTGVASGFTNVNYAWRKNGTLLNDGTTASGSIISGSHTLALAITNAHSDDAADYDCVVSNSCGSAISSAATLGVLCCTADSNHDGQVNVADLLTVINHWGACPAPPTECPGDIAPSGGDGVVNVADMLLVINNWGTCPR